MFDSASADTGPGVEPHLHDRLFAPFDRLDADAKGIEGTGLGLALSKGLMEAIGGSLGVDSEPGERFDVLARIAARDDVDELRRVELDVTPHTPDSNEARSATVLVHRGQHRQRAPPGAPLGAPTVTFDLITSMQGSEGFELAHRHRPDLILLDVHMPDLSGYEVLELLRADERTASIPVVMLSADASHEQMQRFRDAGARDYLTKPLDLQNFLTQLDEYLRER